MRTYKKPHARCLAGLSRKQSSMTLCNSQASKTNNGSELENTPYKLWCYVRIFKTSTRLPQMLSVSKNLQFYSLLEIWAFHYTKKWINTISTIFSWRVKACSNTLVFEAMTDSLHFNKIRILTLLSDYFGFSCVHNSIF